MFEIEPGARRSFAWVIPFLVLASCTVDEPREAYVAAATRVRTTPIDPFRDDYFAAPWPDDRRLDTEGFVVTADFPNPMYGGLFGHLLERGEHLVRGWGLSSPIYLPFTGTIDPSSLPADAVASVASDSSLFLVAIDPNSPVYGQRVFLEWKVFEEATLFLPGHVLAVRPVVGFPLHPGTRYALVVTTGVKDASGFPVGPDEGMWRALADAPDRPPSDLDRDYWAPLKAFLTAKNIPVSRVAGATLFTTQRILDELLVIRDHLLAQEPPQVEGLSFVGGRPGYQQVEGRYTAPNYQHGAPPYLMDGGDFQVDADGTPVIGEQEEMRLTIRVPTAQAPAAGYPVLFYSHGTGGDYQTVVDDGTCTAMAAEGIAAVGIDQVIHGPRAKNGGSCFGQPPENCFFNIVNPVAGRNLIRQAALDHVSVRRAIEGLEIPTSVVGRAVRFDLSHFGYFGHSQGGLSGALYLAIDPALKGALLSGSGGHLTTSILVRDNGDVKKLVESAAFLAIDGQESLEQLHPALALIQTLAEVADPLSYARHWLKEPPGTRSSVFLVNGVEDPYTPASTAEAMAAAAGVPQLEGAHRLSPVHELAGLVPVPAPVTGNIQEEGPLGKATAVLRQFPGQGHFPIFYDPSARAQLRAFFRTLATEPLPTVIAPSN